MAWWEALAAAGAQAGNSIMGSLFNANQAEVARHYTTRMSNTAHQREMADLLAAGLNPILSVMGGPGASTPGSGSGSFVGGDFAGAITNARRLSEVDKVRLGNETRSVDKELQKRDAEIGLVNAQRELTHNSAIKVARELPLMQLENEFWTTLAPIARDALRAVGRWTEEKRRSIAESSDPVGGVLDAVKNNKLTESVRRFQRRYKDAGERLNELFRGFLLPESGGSGPADSARRMHYMHR